MEYTTDRQLWAYASHQNIVPTTWLDCELAVFQPEASRKNTPARERTVSLKKRAGSRKTKRLRCGVSRPSDFAMEVSNRLAWVDNRIPQFGYREKADHSLRAMDIKAVFGSVER